MKTLHIIELTISNCKRIRALELRPEDGRPVTLTGTNGAGKSTVLDAILLGLQNSGPAQPIRQGADKCVIKLKLSDGDETELTVRRSFTASGGHSLTVTDELGRQIPSPQKFLDGILGADIAFDPLAFQRAKPKEQARIIREITGLDFSDIETERARLYAERTVANRQKADLSARFEALTKPDPNAPNEEQSASDIMAEIEALNNRRRELDDMHQQELAHKNAVEASEAEIVRLQQALDEARLEHSRALEKCTRASEATEMAEMAGIRSTDIPAELEKKRAALKNVEAINAAVRAKRDYASQREALKAAIAAANELDEKVKALDMQKEERIAKAKMPYPGMAFTEEGVTINGVPFQQCSTGDSIAISTCVGMAEKPAVKIILIREGSLINKSNWHRVIELARERNYQIWVEVMREEPGESGFHIIDGALAVIDGKPVEAVA